MTETGTILETSTASDADSPPPPPPPAPPGPPGPEDSGSPGPAGPPPRSWGSGFSFIRPSEGRIVGGVCAGIAQAAGIDVLLVRIAAVVLVAFGGIGALLYVALWLLTPSTDAEPRVAPGTSSGARRFLTVLLVLAAAGVLLGRARWYGLGGAALSLAVLVGVIVVLMERRRVRIALAVCLAVLLALVGLVAGFGSHLGDRSYTVGQSSDLWRTYSAATGTLRLDLAALPAGAQRHVRAVVGSGKVVVTLPPSTSDVTVHVRGRAGVGAVHVLGRNASGIAPELTTDAAGSGSGLSDGGNGSADLWLDAIAGTGTVTVRAG